MTAHAKRILFVAPPGYGHLFPLVPLAWALRGAGQDVRIATCGVSVNATVRAGLSVVNVAPGVDVAAIQSRYRDDFKHTYPPAAARRVSEAAAGAARSVFSELCDVMADGVVDAAREWRPNLIVYTPEAGAALIAATHLDIRSIFFSVGLGHTPGLMRERYVTMGATCERHGVPEIVPGGTWIDVSPPTLRESPSDGWPMRYVQYNGGTVVQSEPPRADRPRIAVTLGTVVPFVCGVTPLRGVVEAARGVDATFVIAYGAGSAADLGPLPPNVQAGSWIALDALLATCSAAIHHGGFGTTLAMLGAGLPQLILPHGADQFYNAARVQQRGAALVADADAIGAADVERLLHDDRLRHAAEEVRTEIASMPHPCDMAMRLLDWLS